jgi:hypothetical protein
MLDAVERITAQNISTRICFGTVFASVVGPGGNHLLSVRVGSTADSTTYTNIPTLVNASVGAKVVWLQSSTGTSVVLGVLV